MKAIDRSGSRIDLMPTDSLREILRLIDSAKLKVLQFTEPLPAKLLLGLNAEFFSYRPDVELRVYGPYSGCWDLSFCALLPNVERFRADNIIEAVGLESISKLTRLSSLGIGIWSLTSFDFLRDVNDKITALYLSQSKSKKPDLAPLRRFINLNILYLESQQKGIDVISELSALEGLTLRSITLDSMELVRVLPRLWSLDLKLGGTNNLSALTGLENLRYLELWQILGLEHIEVISSLTGLESFFLQSLSRVSAIPPLDHLTKLRKIRLEEMKGLKDISALSSAPALEELNHVSSKSSVEDYLTLLESRTLKAAHVGFGSEKKNVQFKKLCEAKGIANDVATGITREMIPKYCIKKAE